MRTIGKFLGVFLLVCGFHSKAIDGKVSDEFAEQWYAGSAEVSSYSLTQARYGEMHEGKAVLIFVTEDFSKSKHVKLDGEGDGVSIMKLNMMKKFNTGIYPYSMMNSVFTPVNIKKYPNSFKVTTSSQEWCGHTFTQLNLKKDGFQFLGRSYFESEGDVEMKLDKVFLEDEVWNRIRLNPESLPTGTVQMMPGNFYLRLRHKDIKVQTAEATYTPGDKISSYKMYYPEHSRTLTIQFKSEFPYQILGWREVYKSGFGPDAKDMITKATLLHSDMVKYWEKNGVADLPLRDEFKLGN